MNRKHKKPYKDLTGQRFGRLAVVSVVDSEAGANIPTKWLCQCDCGNLTQVQGSNLKSGVTQSCGCLQREMARERQLKHGKTGSRLYVIWSHMRHRCEYDWEYGYEHYGGRGITVCDEWKEFEPFYKWAIESGYADNLTLDRIDVNGNYCPKNCRWATQKEQNLNKRTTVRIEYNGEFKTESEWADIFSCHPQYVCRNILALEGRVTKGGENIETHSG